MQRWSYGATCFGLSTVQRGIICLLVHGVSTSFHQHVLVSHNSRVIAFNISEEDIQQTLPGTLEAFEAGVSSSTICGFAIARLIPPQVDDGQTRQHVLSTDLFTVHGDNLDDFGLYVKCKFLSLPFVALLY